MILLFLLAAMAMVGGFALSWKATPAASSGIGLSKEEFRQMIQEELRKANQEMQAPSLAAEERRLLELKAKVLEEKLVNLQQSYEEELARRKAADKALTELKGQLPDAQLAKAKKSLEQGDTKVAKETFAEVRKQTGKLAALAAYSEGQLAEGEVNYAEAMELYGTAVLLEKDNPDYLLAAGKMARTLGNYAKAQEWLEQLVKMREAEGKDDVDLALAQHELAWLYDDQGQYDKAESLYKRSLEIREKVLGKDHPDVAKDLNNLAELYRAQDRYAEAEPLYKRALAIMEQKLGKDHPNVSAALNNLAVLYHSQARYAEAESLYKRSLEIREKTLGKEHPHVAATLNNLAGLYETQGKYEEAEPLYKRSLEIREDKLGRDHPDVAITLNNMAELYEAQEKYAETEPLYQRSLSILKAKLPAGHLYIKTVQENYDELKGKHAGQ